MSVPVLLFACVHNGGRHAAARAVQSGEATGPPKSHDGPVEALCVRKAVHRSANKART